MTDWAEKRLLEVIGEEDEVVLAYVKGILQAGGSPEAKAIHVTLDGFLGAVSTHCPLGARYTRAATSRRASPCGGASIPRPLPPGAKTTGFVSSLWEVLLDAQQQSDGVPAALRQAVAAKRQAEGEAGAEAARRDAEAASRREAEAAAEARETARMAEAGARREEPSRERDRRRDNQHGRDRRRQRSESESSGERRRRRREREKDRRDIDRGRERD